MTIGHNWLMTTDAMNPRRAIRRQNMLLQTALRQISIFRPTLIEYDDSDHFFPVFPCLYPAGTVCITQFDRRVVFSDRDDAVLERTFSTRDQADKFMANIPSVVEYIWVLNNGFR